MEVSLPVRVVAPLLIALAALAGCGGTSDGGKPAADDVVLTPQAAAKARAHDRTTRRRRSHAQVVQLTGAGETQRPSADGAVDDRPSPGAPSDAQVRSELREARAALADFKRYLNTTAFLQTGPRARVLRDGTAVAPDDAPDIVKRVILAGNQIAKFPYKWGGGHGAWRDNGYDCSGSVSFALAGAGLMNSPLTSGMFMSWGDAGPGRWITIYANNGHVWMTVAGLRFDTSGANGFTRWQSMRGRSTAGFVMRHPPGY
jgi:cell wall-associated NlpC family hydrolase